MAFIRTIPPAEANGPVREMYQQVEKRLGYVPNWAQAFSLRPGVRDGWGALLQSIQSNLSVRAYELATLAAARALRSSYCCLAHGSVLADKVFDQAAVHAIVSGGPGSPLEPGERAMMKVKQHRTADCVVGGFRYRRGSNEVGSLLLGLYDEEGKLDHVGFTATIANKDRAALTAKLEALVSPPGFTGKAPGGPSRWSTERSEQWQPVKPKLVVEVSYDQVTGNRFRHGTKIVRFRPDKAPRQCTFEQVAPQAKPAKLVADMLKS